MHNKKTEVTVLFLFLLTYFVIATRDITLPGVSFEESASANGSINFLLNKKTSYIFYIPLLGKQFPLMIPNHLPALVSYLLLPFFLFLGIDVSSLRIASISFGVLTLFFTYLFTKEFFNRKVAIITLLLLATSPYFIIATKIGNYLHSYWLFFSMAALFYFLKWYKNGNIAYFISAVLLLGFGASTTSWFIIFLSALSILAVVFRKEIKERIKKDRVISPWFYITFGFISFCLGDFLFLYANLIHKPRFITISWLFRNFRNTSFGINNFDYVKNLSLRLENLESLLGEADLIKNISFSNIIGNQFYPYLFFFVIEFLVLSLFLKKNMYFKKKKIVFLIILIFAILAFSPVTVSSFSSWHLFVLAPFIHISVAVGLLELCYFFENKIIKKISMITAISFVLISIGINLNILRNYYINIKKIIYRDIWSDNIYQLANWLKINKPSRVISINLGFFRNLYFLTRGEVYVEDRLSFLSEGVKNDLAVQGFLELFRTTNNIYLFNAQTRVQFGKYERADLPRLESFMEAVNLSGKSLIEEKVFYQKDGQPIYFIYRVE